MGLGKFGVGWMGGQDGRGMRDKKGEEYPKYCMGRTYTKKLFILYLEFKCN